MQRLQRLDNELLHQVKNWRYYPVVKAIQAMQGVRLLVALGTIADSATYVASTIPENMKHVGLVPTESSSGGKTKRGEPHQMRKQSSTTVLIEAHILISTS